MTELIMDNHIWNDIRHTAKSAKVYALCCSKYANKMRKRNHIIEWLMIIIPAVGAGTYLISSVCALWSTIITAACNFIKKVDPIVTQSESELSKLDGLQTDFNKICTKLENAFHSFRLQPDVTDTDLLNILNDTKAEIDELRTQMDKIVRKTPNEDLLNNEASEYINNKFNSNNPVNGY